MRKKSAASKFWNGLSAVFLAILGIAVVAFAGLGIWKTVDLVKEYQQKNTEEQEEQKTPEAGTTAICIEEEIANNMVA